MKLGEHIKKVWEDSVENTKGPITLEIEMDICVDTDFNVVEESFNKINLKIIGPR